MSKQSEKVLRSLTSVHDPRINNILACHHVFFDPNPPTLSFLVYTDLGRVGARGAESALGRSRDRDGTRGAESALSAVRSRARTGDAESAESCSRRRAGARGARRALSAVRSPDRTREA